MPIKLKNYGAWIYLIKVAVRRPGCEDGATIVKPTSRVNTITNDRVK